MTEGQVTARPRRDTKTPRNAETPRHRDTPRRRERACQQPKQRPPPAAGAPPAGLFGPVWTVLYATIGLAGWLVRRRAGDPGRRRALAWWGVQLAANLAWTPLFFGARQYGLALLDILLLVAALLVTLGLFLRVRRAAGLLLVPYLAWVCFATALNAAIWQANT